MEQEHHLRHPTHTVEGGLSLSMASKCVITAVGAIIACYALALLGGWPQHATKLIIEENASTAAGPTEGAAPEPGAAEAPPVVMVLPFVLMLGAIAVMPVLHGAKHWWDSNLHRFYVAGGLALITILYYPLAHQ